MKKRLLLILPVFWLYSVHIYAQVSFITNSIGDTVAFEAPNGCIKSAESHMQVSENGIFDVPGSVEANRILDTLDATVLINFVAPYTILDPAGETLATYNHVTKQLIASNGYRIFSINTENEILNAANEMIGRIEQDGGVFGADGLKVGRGMGIDIFKLAYLFFYNNK
ncbi:MAG TPA: hypothetical protein VD905_16335 [Flavobacteriales bacterium]|nr:hypothetical protein [Flavobacteriales bacterium]